MGNKGNQFQELGATGLKTWGGQIFEEHLSKLAGDAWRKAIRDMTANDPVIGAFLYTLEMLVRQTNWYVEPFADKTQEDLERGDFIKNCLFDDMSMTWQDSLSEIITFCPWGWSYFEKCWKRRSGDSLDPTRHSKYNDGRIGIRKLAPRSQESLYKWNFNEFNEVEAMVQMPPPDYKLRTIPYKDALHFRTSSNKNNPEGFSGLRRCYRPWFFKSNIENIEGIGIERELAGLPFAGVPPEVLTSDDPEVVKMREAIIEMLSKVRQNEKAFVLFPLEFDKDGNPKYEFKLVSSAGTRQFDTSKVIDRYDQRILMSLMADFLLLGSKATGSYALSTDKSELFTTGIEAYLDTICDEINRGLIPRLMRLNGWDAQRSPKLAHGNVQKVSLKEIGDFIRTLSQAKVGLSDKQAEWLKRQIPGMPAEDTETGNK